MKNGVVVKRKKNLGFKYLYIHILDVDLCIYKCIILCFIYIYMYINFFTISVTRNISARQDV